MATGRHLIGTDRVSMNFIWYETYTGCSVGGIKLWLNKYCAKCILYKKSLSFKMMKSSTIKILQFFVKLHCISSFYSMTKTENSLLQILHLRAFQRSNFMISCDFFTVHFWEVQHLDMIMALLLFCIWETTFWKVFYGFSSIFGQLFFL